MADVRPSIPRTPAQVTLRVVSAIMALLGVLVVVGAALVFLNRDQLGLAEESMWTVLTYGGIILIAAGLLLLTAWLGFRAADDSSRVGPYRFLCYFVGLVVLVAIVWGWGMGMFLLFNPVVLASTVTYVLVCSQLADKVAEEHEAGVKGEVFLRTGRQRTLHLLAEVVLVKGAILGVVVAVMAVTVKQRLVKSICHFFIEIPSHTQGKADHFFKIEIFSSRSIAFSRVSSRTANCSRAR